MIDMTDFAGWRALPNEIESASGVSCSSLFARHSCRASAIGLVHALQNHLATRWRPRTHRLATVQKADRIYVLANGRVVEAGRFKELMAPNGHFAALARRQLA